jgi:cobalt-zinc-cadmium efflux system outer membrane protein
MPKMALVAFVVALGLGFFTLSSQAWSSEVNAAQLAEIRTATTISKITDQPNTEQTSEKAPLTLAEALSRTIKKNASLAAFSLEIQAREHEALQAGLRPNPELSVELENMAGRGEFAGTDGAETTVSISQLIELGGKRSLRRAVGTLDQGLATEEYHIALVEVLAQTRERFVAVIVARMRLQLADEQVELAGNVLQTIESRIADGKSAAIESSRFQGLLVEAQLQQVRNRQELTVARKTLSATWNSEEVDFGAVQGELESLPPLPEWQEITDLLQQSPRVTLHKKVEFRSRQALELERANRLPDLTVSLGARNLRETDDNMLVAEVSIPLTIFDRNQGAIGAARTRVSKAREEKRAAFLRIRTALVETWQQLKSARHEVETVRDQILPIGQKTFEAVSYGYRAGKFGYLDVLDAQRTLFETKDRYIDALARYHLAASNLEHLLGGKLPNRIPSETATKNEREQS